MRIPLVPDLDSRVGLDTKDEQLRNVLAQADVGVTLAVTRPGLVTAQTFSGNGNGLTALEGELFSVFGTTLRNGSMNQVGGTLASGPYDFAASPL